MPANYAHITVEDHGRLVAEADVRAEEDLVRAQLRVEAGHVPPGARTELVDAVLASPAVEPGTPLQMTVPAGDGEILQRDRERCCEVDARAAGATCLVHTTTPAS